MAEYQRIEYRIGKDGKIVETAIAASGTGCVETTKEIEKALGTVEQRELLPEYYTDSNVSLIAESQFLAEGRNGNGEIGR